VLNSATLVTQNVTVTAAPWTLSFYGTGTVTKSGTATGALVGTGAAQRVSQTFTPTAGTLTLTVTGTVTNAQLEAGAFATSYIPTVGTTVARSADSATMPTAPWHTSPTAFSYLLQGMVPAYGGTISALQFDDGTVNNRSVLSILVTTGLVQYFENNGGVTTNISAIAGPVGVGTAFKAAVSTVSAAHAYAVNGGVVTTGANVANPPAVTTLRLGRGVNPSTGLLYLQRVRYWPRSMLAPELQGVTA